MIEKTKSQSKQKEKKKSCTYESINALHEGKELGFKS